MAKSVFVSYVYEDLKWVKQIEDWAGNGLLGSDVKITKERKDVRHLGDNAIEEEIKTMIQGASLVIFLIGQDSHNHPWIEYEIECTQSKHKKYIVVRIPGTNGKLPQKLSYSKAVEFSPSALKIQVNQ